MPVADSKIFFKQVWYGNSYTYKILPLSKPTHTLPLSCLTPRLSLSCQNPSLPVTCSFLLQLHVQYLTPIRTNTSYPTLSPTYTFRTQTLLYPLAYSFLLPLHIAYHTFTLTKTYITPILPYITPHLSLSYHTLSLPPVNDSDTSCQFSCRFKKHKSESAIGN